MARALTRVSGGGQDMQAGPGCQGFGDPNGPANDNSVFCPTNDILRLQVDLLDGDDEFGTEGFEATVNAGAGEDEITIGRTGSDGVNTIDGGPDDDTIDAGRAGEADDLSGGSGLDTVTYASHAPVTVTLDGASNDGSSAEQDNVRPDVEKVIGTGGDDTLTGSGGDDTLDGAGGTDRLEGLGGADTLIGGLGTDDATFGGEGDDTIMLRDGLVDACPNGGPGTNTEDVDLIDLRRIIGRTTIPRCILLRVPALPRDIIFGGAVDEGPNVRMTVPPPAVRRAGVRVRLACPAALRAPCAGSLRVFTLRGTRPLGRVAYSVRPGRARAVSVPLDAEARGRPRDPSAPRRLGGEGALEARPEDDHPVRPAPGVVSQDGATLRGDQLRVGWRLSAGPHAEIRRRARAPSPWGAGWPRRPRAAER